ncbi:MAG: polyhydroxybutyrate depolymerase [Pseudomonadota bacterium]
MRRFGLIVTCSMAFVAPAAACGPDTDCQLGDRTYRIQMPESAEGKVGALIFAHGYRGSAKGTMRNKALRSLANELGVALVATKSASQDWLIPGVPENTAEDGLKEFEYYDALIDDLEQKFGIDRDNLVASGFSAGGMMVWNLACQRGGAFSAFIPIAGTFWQPVPVTCPSFPVNLVHIHGTADKIVPLEGRKIAQTRQGSVTKAMSLLKTEGVFGDPSQSEGSGLACETAANDKNQVLGFCTHPGGHSIKMDYLRKAWQMLQDAGAIQ